MENLICTHHTFHLGVKWSFNGRSVHYFCPENVLSKPHVYSCLPEFVFALCGSDITSSCFEPFYGKERAHENLIYCDCGS